MSLLVLPMSPLSCNTNLTCYKFGFLPLKLLEVSYIQILLLLKTMGKTGSKGLRLPGLSSLGYIQATFSGYLVIIS